jgi:spore coat polysaccharide biosynthesis protein SpsF (cytidylyltransferase family)
MATRSHPTDSLPRVAAIAVLDLGDFSLPHVQARASRFAERKLGGHSLLMRMARRITECQWVDRVFIVGSNIPAPLLNGGISGVEIMNLPSMHACERIAVAADASSAEWVVCLPANRPFVDAALIDQLISAAVKAGECDYAGYGNGLDDCERIEHLGLAGEVCHVDTLRRLRRNCDRLPADSEHGAIASWLAVAPGAYHLKFVPLPAALDRDDLRFAVQDESDWDDMQLLCETVSHEEAQWDGWTKLIAGSDSLRRSMS